MYLKKKSIRINGIQYARDISYLFRKESANRKSTSKPMEIKEELKEMYDSQYSDQTEEWRRIGAVGKADNIIHLTTGFTFANLIEIGAGDGNVLAQLSQRKFCPNLTAAEISDSAIRQIEKKSIARLTEIKQFDGYCLPFANQQFDLAVCSHVIEHVEYPRKLLREIKRISRRQVFEVPIDFSLRVDEKFDHFNAYGHINIYTPALFNFLLYTEGFEIIRNKYALYRPEVLNYQYKKNSPDYLRMMAKRLLWKSIPKLMKLKPNTYTVLTQ